MEGGLSDMQDKEFIKKFVITQINIKKRAKYGKRAILPSVTGTLIQITDTGKHFRKHFSLLKKILSNYFDTWKKLNNLLKGFTGKMRERQTDRLIDRIADGPTNNVSWFTRKQYIKMLF